MKKLSNRKILKLHIKPEYKMRRLTKEEKNNIKNLYFLHDWTIKRIADEYGVATSTVWYHVQSVDSLNKVKQKRKKYHAEWQKRTNYDRIKLERYLDMYEKGMLM